MNNIAFSDHFRWGSPDYGNTQFQSFSPKKRTFLFPTIPGEARPLPTSPPDPPTPPPDITAFLLCLQGWRGSQNEVARLLRERRRPASTPAPAVRAPGPRFSRPVPPVVRREETSPKGDGSMRRYFCGEAVAAEKEAAVAAAADDGEAAAEVGADNGAHRLRFGDAGLSSGSNSRVLFRVAPHAMALAAAAPGSGEAGEGEGRARDSRRA